jgi:hypothetical protein
MFATSVLRALSIAAKIVDFECQVWSHLHVPQATARAILCALSIWQKLLVSVFGAFFQNL